jgi:protein-tyrosine phosphatase
MKPDLYWIPGPWRGRLAIAARPRGGDWLSDEATGWRDGGVDVMVSLLEEDEAAQLNLSEEASTAEAKGIHFLSFPILDRGVPTSMSEAQALIAEISDSLKAGKNVAVHCRQGIGRSGMIAAAILANSGQKPDEAMRAVSAARGLTVPETAEQRAWIERLGAQRPVLAG